MGAVPREHVTEHDHLPFTAGISSCCLPTTKGGVGVARGVVAGGKLLSASVGVLGSKGIDGKEEGRGKEGEGGRGREEEGEGEGEKWRESGEREGGEERRERERRTGQRPLTSKNTHCLWSGPRCY